jgi:hypothetical protein
MLPCGGWRGSRRQGGRQGLVLGDGACRGWWPCCCGPWPGVALVGLLVLAAAVDIACCSCTGSRWGIAVLGHGRQAILAQRRCAVEQQRRELGRQLAALGPSWQGLLAASSGCWPGRRRRRRCCCCCCWTRWRCSRGRCCWRAAAALLLHPRAEQGCQGCQPLGPPSASSWRIAAGACCSCIGCCLLLLVRPHSTAERPCCWWAW